MGGGGGIIASYNGEMTSLNHDPSCSSSGYSAIHEINYPAAMSKRLGYLQDKDFYEG